MTRSPCGVLAEVAFTQPEAFLWLVACFAWGFVAQ